ncbi:MAG: YIP1 family protein [Deltaproteobacteria bacterium]
MILRTYRAPGSVMDALLDQPRFEGRGLAMLMGGCAMIAISTLPHLLAQTSAVPNEARVSATLFAWLAIAPLAFYAIALVLDLLRRLIRLPSDGYTTRIALFWSVLAATPLWLLNGIGLTIPNETIKLVFGLIALIGFLFLVSAHLRAAYRRKT